MQRDGDARRGELELSHGRVQTPAFMPVGTYGSVKAMSPDELVALGAEIVLGNTFHLWLRPGVEVIARHEACTASWAGSARYSPTRADSRSSAWGRSGN